MARHIEIGGGVGGIVKIGALLGVGWYLYKNWDSFTKPANATGVLTTAQPSGTPIAAPVGTVSVAPVLTTADASTLRQKIQQYLATDPGFPATGATYDQWNWIRWKYMSAPESQGDIFPGRPRDEVMTIDQYLEGLQAHGISGVRGGVPAGGGGLFGIDLGNIFASPASLGSVLDFAAFYQAGPHKQERKGNFR